MNYQADNHFSIKWRQTTLDSVLIIVLRFSLYSIVAGSHRFYLRQDCIKKNLASSIGSSVGGYLALYHIRPAKQAHARFSSSSPYNPFGSQRGLLCLDCYNRDRDDPNTCNCVEYSLFNIYADTFH